MELCHILIALSIRMQKCIPTRVSFNRTTRNPERPYLVLSEPLVAVGVRSARFQTARWSVDSADDALGILIPN